MAKSNERRVFERYEDDSSIVFSAMGLGNFNNSKTYNCSSGGMYFNSDFELPRGAEVCVKMIHYRSVFHAEVARCEAKEINGKKCFGIGIRYLEPV